MSLITRARLTVTNQIAGDFTRPHRGEESVLTHGAPHIDVEMAWIIRFLVLSDQAAM